MINIIRFNVEDLYIIILILFIILSLTFRYLKVLKYYLKQIMIAANKVSRGNFAVELEKNMGGELGELTYNFNYMIKKIKWNIIELEENNIKLKSILKSISNGILVLDSKGRIVIMNDLAKGLLDYYKEDYEGKFFENIVTDLEIQKTVKDMIISKEKIKYKIVKNKNLKYIKIKVDPIRYQGEKKINMGLIINFEDITERKLLEKMKSEFVANVTHELKTPLTSISGFIETLKNNLDMDLEMRLKFLNIIDSESERLKSLIEDILTLSFVESNESSNNRNQNVNLNKVLEEVLELTNSIAKKKNIEIKNNNLLKEGILFSNKEYIKQILLNLIDNAIKYTIDGGFIEVTLIEEEKKFIILVKDTGMGISKEDISRIFERFYRVDKARSKKIGGTGLGLAIVKHIVFSLEGKIFVESELNKGSEFKIILPKKLKKD